MAANETPAAPLEGVRDWLIRELDAETSPSDAGAPWRISTTDDAARVALTAQALDHVDAVLARRAQVEPPPAPPCDVDRLRSAVWNGLQEAGAPTRISDAALDIIDRVLHPGPREAIIDPPAAP